MFLKKFFRLKRLSLWMVVLPMVVATLYYCLLSVNRYVSTAQVVVVKAGPESAAGVSGAMSLAAGVTGPSLREETLYLHEYIVSNEMLDVLEDQLDWRAHFSAQHKDLLFRISSTDTREEVLAFYRRMVHVHYDEVTGLLAVEVQALSPEFTQAVLRTILAECERFVERLSLTLAHAQLQFAQTELVQSQTRYEQQREAMVAFQRRYGLVDGQAAAESRVSIIDQLTQERAKAHAALAALRSALSDSTPQVQQLYRRIQGLDAQIEAEAKTLSSNAARDDALNVIADQYRKQKIELGFAEDRYKAAMMAVDSARIDAGRKQRSLLVVIAPNRPEQPAYPARLHDLLTVLVVLLLIYGVTRFVVAAIEDHRD